jgi:NAD(P)-dependent dehydrogenase (short-subunit alcohol dehydrogenase family)
MAKTIVITGTTRGIGRAMAVGFAARGHVVAGCGRSADAIAGLAAELGPPHDFAVVDVADDAAVERWAERVLVEVGPPDLLVNNAGLINENAPLWEVPPGEFSAVIDVNVKGTYHVIRHFLPAMARRGRGVIVNVTSGWGRSTSPDVAPYCASKWALEGLTRALADEVPAGLAAIPLNPGVIDTAMLRTCWGDGAAAYPDPEAWAERAVPFLLGLGPKDNGRPLTAP